MLRVVGIHAVENIDDVTRLQEVLGKRDARDGALFWIYDGVNEYPCIALRVSGGDSDIHFFPSQEHPGLRCLADGPLSDHGFTKLVFEGCDPSDGEETPNQFVLSFDKSLRVVSDFYRNRQMSDAFDWFEL